MHIIIREDPDDGFRSKVGSYWWELVDGGKVIAESPKTYKSHESAYDYAREFVLAIRHADLSRVEIKDE